MIGSSSPRIKERLADGDVIVVEVIKEPLLARGLLGVFDISLCDEVVVGFITCGRGSFSAKVPRSSAEVRRVLIHDIMEVGGVRQWEQQCDQRDDEEGDEVSGEVEETRSNAHSTHES